MLPLQLASVTLAQVAAHRHGIFTGTVYVATPQLLARYGIKASQISPGTDILTAVPGLAGLPQLLMAWGNVGGPSGPSPVPGQSVSQSCTPGNDCLSSHL